MSEESAKLRMNLVAIQNVDPYANEILAMSPHVAFYKFANDRNEWEKSEIEGNFCNIRNSYQTFMISNILGSFFVYSRVAEPFNSIFINNRLNNNSLVEPITKHIELQQQKPFLLYRNQRSAISGFWFYCEDDCLRVHALLERLIKCNNVRPTDNGNNKSNHHVVPQQHHQQQHQVYVKGQNGGDVDIFSMLSKAQEDFNKSGVIDGPQLNKTFAAMHLNHPPPPIQQIHHHQHQLQPLLMKQMSNAMPDITSPNVVNFFAAAQIPNGVPVKGDGQIIPSQTKPFISNHPLAQPVPTLDEIEKQHRVSSSPPQQKVGELANCVIYKFLCSLNLN